MTGVSYCIRCGTLKLVYASSHIPGSLLVTLLVVFQVVTGANGEKTLREVTRRLADAKAGGNAPVPVSQVANPAPAAIAAMPGGAASAASTASSSKPNRVVYGQPTKKPNVNVHVRLFFLFFQTVSHLFL